MINTSWFLKPPEGYLGMLHNLNRYDILHHNETAASGQKYLLGALRPDPSRVSYCFTGRFTTLRVPSTLLTNFALRQYHRGNGLNK